MDFVKYIKPLLMFVHHLDLDFFATGTPSYKLVKFLVPKLSSIIFNEFTVKDSFTFAEEILHQDCKLFMGSLNVDVLYTDIPLKEIINICTNLLYNKEDFVEGINKSEFKNLLLLAPPESFFIFNDVIYKQKDGVAMGSPLGPTIANVFLSFYKVKWLQQYPKEFKPVFYRRYVDGISVLFKLAESLSKFCDYFNNCHPNMSFSFFLISWYRSISRKREICNNCLLEVYFKWCMHPL